jgi:AraC-like DNA-binding protein
MLSMRTIVCREGVELADVVCRHPRGRGQATEYTNGHVVVFVRRGCFVRWANGAENLLDATVAYCMNAGDEQRYDHPQDHGDECTSFHFDADAVASIWGGDPILPADPLALTPPIDLEHRLLLVAARSGADSHELVERAIALTARALESTDPRRVASGRPSTARARRALADGVREALATRPETSLRELAGALAVSPHHLSRTFRASTGHTIARHRMRLRVRSVLNRLADGERDLARIAADVGFVDHSHLCRVVRSETGHTPSALRRALA